MPPKTKTTPGGKPAPKAEPKPPAKAEAAVELKGKFSKKVGLSSKLLEKLFTAPRPSEGVTKLTELLTSRVLDGRRAGLNEHRIYAAIDAAYDAPFNQTTPTILRSIASRNLDEKQTLEELKKWGLAENELFIEVEDDAGNKVKALNPKTFFNVLVPLVKSTLMSRLSKLFNDRNQFPFFSYAPATSTESNRVICEIVTSIVSKIAHQYGYPAVLRDVLFNSLMYATAFAFPSEAWDVQWDTDDAGKDFAKAEGLRYSVPHPSRMFWDRNYRPATFNTDTGCEYAGYWRVVRFGDIGEKYWNKDKISFGTNWFKEFGHYFTEIYPCTAKNPFEELPSGLAETDREKVAGKYATNDHDKAAFLTDIFMKVRPSDYGLSTYKHKIWFRFVLANDDTVVWAEPLPYCPVLYMGYDADGGRARNSSMALEIIPWQDHMGNIFTNILLSCKQNLAKIVPYDTEQLDKKDIRQLKTHERQASGIVWFPYSSKKAKIQQVDPSKMFLPVSFPYQDVTQLTQTIASVIAIMERVLGMSASEVGAAGVHIQTAEEIRVISNNTSTRVDYTGSFVDDFFDAWKRQNYQAIQAFMDEDFVAQVADADDRVTPVLEKLGFELGDASRDGGVEVKGKKSKLVMESFASTREGQNRINQPQIAQTIMQTLQVIANSPVYSQVVDPQELLKYLNLAAQLSGAPKDFKVKGGNAQAKQMEALQQQLQAMGQQIQQGAVQQVGQALKPLADKVTEDDQKIQQLGQAAMSNIQQMQQVRATLAKLAQLVEGAMQAPPPRPPGMIDQPPIG